MSESTSYLVDSEDLEDLEDLLGGSTTPYMDLLRSDDMLLVQSFCDDNPEVCDSQELWRELFKLKFPDLYDPFREVSVPFTSLIRKGEKLTGIEPSGGSGLRKPLFWRDCYMDLHNMAPEITAFVEELINGDIEYMKNGKVIPTVYERILAPMTVLLGSFWSIVAVLANLYVSRDLVVPSLLFLPEGHHTIDFYVYSKYDRIKRGTLASMLRIKGLDLPEVSVVHILGEKYDYRIKTLLTYASTRGYAKATDILLRNVNPAVNITESILGTMLESESVHQHPEVVLEILRYEQFSREAFGSDFSLSTVLLNKIFQNGSVYGSLKVVRFLLKDKRVDPAADDNEAIVAASFKGELGIVRLLLKDKRVDPSARDNGPMVEASTHGHLGVMRLLFDDGRVDPAARRNMAISEASSNGQLEAVRILLAKGVDPSVGVFKAISDASAGGYAEIVLLLLEDERVDPSVNENEAIRDASANGHLEVVRILMKDERVDPGASVHEVIRAASEYGHLEVVRLLLGDKRVNPAAKENSAMWLALAAGHLEIVLLLLGDKRVELSAAGVGEALKQTNRAMRDAVDGRCCQQLVQIIVLLTRDLALPKYEWSIRFPIDILKAIARARGMEVDLTMSDYDLAELLSKRRSHKPKKVRPSEKLSIKELRTLASEKKLPGRSKMKKEELKKALFGDT